MYFFAALIFLLFAWSLIIERIRLDKKRKRFSDRKELTMDEIYSKHLSSPNVSKSLAIEHWINIARLLKLKPGLLRPSDRIDWELGPEKNDPLDDEIEDVLDWYWGIAEDHGLPFDPNKVNHLGDFVCFFSQKQHDE